MYVVFETLQISIIEKYFSYVQDHKILRAGSENLQDTTCKVNPSIILYTTLNIYIDILYVTIATK